MRHLTTLCFLICCVVALAQPKEPELYPARDRGLWGYINQKGKMVIKPRYEDAWYFNEGLSPVRIGGLYGYINERDSMVIAPRFDFAEAFYGEQALVHIDGKPLLIDKLGKVLFDHDYKELAFWSRTFGIATTQSNESVLIDVKGHLISDAVFSDRPEYSDGLFLVKKTDTAYLNDNEPGIVTINYGLIDTLGKWVVPFGEYSKITDFKNGFARVIKNNAIDDKKQQQFIINKQGNRMFTIPPDWDFEPYGYKSAFHNGIAVFDLDIGMDNNYWIAATDTSGNLLFKGNWESIIPFNKNRAFVTDSNDYLRLINTSGALVTQDSFLQVIDFDERYPEFLFRYGVSFVETNKGWRLIDTMGHYLYGALNLSKINEKTGRRIREFSDNNGILFIQENGKYGLWYAKQNKLVMPIYQRLNITLRQLGLMYAERGDTMVYLSKNGKEVYVERKLTDKDTASAIYKPLDVEIKNISSYYISADRVTPISQYKKSNDAIGIDFLPGSLQLILDTTKSVSWKGKSKGMVLSFINATQDTVQIERASWRQFLRLEAWDKFGKWTSIENWYSQQCGFGLERGNTPFAPNSFVEFEVPEYTGSYKTKIRARLAIDEDETNVIYSNEIEATINPSQLWKTYKMGLDYSYTIR